MQVNGINGTMLTPIHQNVSYYKVDPNTIILNPNKEDILCGPSYSRANSEHPGNIALRNYIEAKQASCNYAQLEKYYKGVVIDETITHFKSTCRFLVFDSVHKGFRKADDKSIRNKVKFLFYRSKDDRDVCDVNASDTEVDYSDVDANHDEADDDGCRECRERMNWKLGIAQTSTQLDDDNEDHTIDRSSSKSAAYPLSNRRLPRINQFEDHHYYIGTKRKFDAAADLASMPSKKKSRQISRDNEMASDNYKSAVHTKSSVHSVTMSFERQNGECSEGLNRGVGRGPINDDEIIPIKLSKR
jgi:hypothetical protein